MCLNIWQPKPKNTAANRNTYCTIIPPTLSLIKSSPKNSKKDFVFVASLPPSTGWGKLFTRSYNIEIFPDIGMDFDIMSLRPPCNNSISFGLGNICKLLTNLRLSEHLSYSSVSWSTAQSKNYMRTVACFYACKVKNTVIEQTIKWVRLDILYATEMVNIKSLTLEDTTSQHI